MIPVDENRLISTRPTFEPKTDGLFLYQLLRYEAHRLPTRVPIVLPHFTAAAQQQLNELWQWYRKDTPVKPALQSAGLRHDAKEWTDRWPLLRSELLSAVNAAGIVAVVVAAVAVVVAALGAAPATATVALAGFAGVLVSGFSSMATGNSGLI